MGLFNFDPRGVKKTHPRTTTTSSLALSVFDCFTIWCKCQPQCHHADVVGAQRGSEMATHWSIASHVREIVLFQPKGLVISRYEGSGEPQKAQAVSLVSVACRIKTRPSPHQQQRRCHQRAWLHVDVESTFACHFALSLPLETSWLLRNSARRPNS